MELYQPVEEEPKLEKPGCLPKDMMSEERISRLEKWWMALLPRHQILMSLNWRSAAEVWTKMLWSTLRRHRGICDSAEELFGSSSGAGQARHCSTRREKTETSRFRLQRVGYKWATEPESQFIGACVRSISGSLALSAASSSFAAQHPK